MSAPAVAFWGQLNTSRELSTNTTIELGRTTASTGGGLPLSKQIVFLVASSFESRHGIPTGLQYRASGLPPMSQVFLMEAPATFNRFASSETFTLNEIDPVLWRGFRPVHAARRVLFTRTLELQTSRLRRLSPQIVLDRQMADDEDA
jgi:hypothetical protein